MRTKAHKTAIKSLIRLYIHGEGRPVAAYQIHATINEALKAGGYDPISTKSLGAYMASTAKAWGCVAWAKWGTCDYDAVNHYWLSETPGAVDPDTYSTDSGPEEAWASSSL
jgi:hypothetical protein